LENDLPAPNRIQATRGRDYLFVYSASGKPFTVVLGRISGKMLNMYWVNPRDGSVTRELPIENTGTYISRPPKSGYGQDWVLVLEDAGKFFPTP
jgi:hypothetical protein